jgi:hypothetical protein
MRTYTNMTWPDDPYRTGQQLYRRPAPRLAAFAAGPPVSGSSLAVTSAAAVYLPLHRTQVLTVTEQTLAFGFRAASFEDEAEAPALAAIADLDLMQARRHAAILAGDMLPGDAAVLRMPAGETVLRGLTAVQREWADRRRPAAGRAAMFDCPLDLPGSPTLEQACQQAGITVGQGSCVTGPDQQAAAEVLAALAVERALIIALVAARHRGRYTWAGTLRTDEIMAADAWDCFPQLPAGSPAAAPVLWVTATTRLAPSPPVLTGGLNDRQQ